MMGSAQGLQIRRLVASAVDLGVDVVDVRRGATA